MIKSVSAGLLAAILLSTPVFAADSDAKGNLAPGGPAGLEKAQEFTVPMIVAFVGVVAVAVTVALVLSNSSTKAATSTVSP